MWPKEPMMQTILSSLRRSGRALLHALCTLNAIQFAAPWQPYRRNCG